MSSEEGSQEAVLPVLARIPIPEFPGIKLEDNMIMEQKNIWIVEPNIDLRNNIANILRRSDWQVCSFGSAEDALQNLSAETCDLFIVDIHLPDQSSFEVVETAKKIKPRLPVLMITGNGDISLAIQALRAGADEFIENALDIRALLSLVESLLARQKRLDPLAGMPLTPRESKILRLVVGGKTTLEIAQILQRSPSTIEDQRSHIMRKLKVRNVAELVRTILQSKSVLANPLPEKLSESRKS